MDTNVAFFAILWFCGSVNAENTCEAEQQMIKEYESLKEKVSHLESQNANLMQLMNITDGKLEHQIEIILL